MASRGTEGDVSERVFLSSRRGEEGTHGRGRGREVRR